MIYKLPNPEIPGPEPSDLLVRGSLTPSVHIFFKLKFFIKFRMADFFLDQNAAPPTQPPVSDPAADFLAAEKSDLAEIEAGTDVVYDQVPTQEGGFQEIEPTETIETPPSEFIPPAETSNDGIAWAKLSFRIKKWLVYKIGDSRIRKIKIRVEG